MSKTLTPPTPTALADEQAKRSSPAAPGYAPPIQDETCVRDGRWRVEVGYDNSESDQSPWYAYKGDSRKDVDEDEYLDWHETAEQAVFACHPLPSRLYWRLVAAVKRLEARVARQAKAHSESSSETAEEKP